MTTLTWVLVTLLLFVGYATRTAGRIDRLHARVDAARASLDAQLVRRAAAAASLAATASASSSARLDDAAHTALTARPDGREQAENDLSRALRAVLPSVEVGEGPVRALEELAAAASRVGLARQFHNDAVRDTRALRGRRVPRLLHLAGHAPLPEYFEIDDTALPRPGPASSPIASTSGGSAVP